MALNMYKQQLANMNRNKNRKGQYAPHKPILLLSIIEQVEMGQIATCRVKLTPVLCKKFKELWDRHVPNGIQFNPDITKPFFHLSREPFWHLVPKGSMGNMNVAEDSGEDEKMPVPQYTLKYMRETFEYAEMDHTLFLLMQAHDSRVELRNILHALLIDTKIHPTFNGKATTLNLAIKGDLHLNGDLLMKKSKKIVKQSVA